MAEIPLRRWLSKQPHPALVVAEFEDGSEKRVRIGVSKSKWRDAEEALKGVVRAEAQDSDGSVLRSWESADAPDTKPKKDAQMLRDIELAKIITSSNDAAVARYRDLFSEAFAVHTKLLGLVVARLMSHERAHEKRMEAEAEAIAAEAAALEEQKSGATDADSMAAQVVSGVLAALQQNGASAHGKDD